MTQADLFFSLLPERFTVYLARHATPDRTRIDIPYTIAPGPELSPRGLEEAAELGRFLCAMGVKTMWGSPFLRTWRTAEIAAGEAAAVLEIDEDLTEWRSGELEPVVLERMQRAFLRCAQASAQNGPVALVSHGGPVLAALKWLGLPELVRERHRVYDSRNLMPPAGAWMAQRDSELTLRLVFVPQGVSMPVIQPA